MENVYEWKKETFINEGTKRVTETGLGINDDGRTCTQWNTWRAQNGMHFLGWKKVSWIVDSTQSENEGDGPDSIIRQKGAV